MEPHDRMSDCSSSPQGKESPQRQKGQKNTAEVKKPRDLPKAKKHKPMDSCYLSNQVLEEVIQWVDRSDQLPVHKVHRPGQPRSVHKEHRPAPVLTMNPLTTMTSTEKENLAQQYRSARSHDSRRTVFYPDLYVLTNNEHWTMTATSTQVCSRNQAILFRTGSLQLDDRVQRSLCLDEVINDSSSAQVDQTRDMLERCMATCGKAAGPQAKREIPCTKRTISSGSTRIIQAVC